MEAFTTDQIPVYCSKRQRSLRLDSPTATVRFIYARGDGWVKTGICGVIQLDVEGGTVTYWKFKCVDGGPPDKAWWVPLDKSVYSQFHYLRIEGI